MPEDSKPVYSCQTGRLCPACGKALGNCRCKQQQANPAGDGIVRIQRQTKGRKGKGVTLVTGVPLTAEELKQLAKKLKQQCGTGGTVKDGIIEIQGDHRQRLQEELQKLGWRVKQAGG